MQRLRAPRIAAGAADKGRAFSEKGGEGGGDPLLGRGRR